MQLHCFFSCHVSAFVWLFDSVQFPALVNSSTAWCGFCEKRAHSGGPSIDCRWNVPQRCWWKHKDLVESQRSTSAAANMWSKWEQWKCGLERDCQRGKTCINDLPYPSGLLMVVPQALACEWDRKTGAAEVTPTVYKKTKRNNDNVSYLMKRINLGFSTRYFLLFRMLELSISWTQGQWGFAGMQQVLIVKVVPFISEVEAHSWDLGWWNVSTVSVWNSIRHLRMSTGLANISLIDLTFTICEPWYKNIS